jgi:hypothetical protein
MAAAPFKGPIPTSIVGSALASNLPPPLLTARSAAKEEELPPPLRTHSSSSSSEAIQDDPPSSWRDFEEYSVLPYFLADPLCRRHPVQVSVKWADQATPFPDPSLPKKVRPREKKMEEISDPCRFFGEREREKEKEIPDRMRFYFFLFSLLFPLSSLSPVL